MSSMASGSPLERGFSEPMMSPSVTSEDTNLQHLCVFAHNFLDVEQAHEVKGGRMAFTKQVQALNIFPYLTTPCFKCT